MPRTAPLLDALLRYGTPEEARPWAEVQMFQMPGAEEEEDLDIAAPGMGEIVSSARAREQTDDFPVSG